MEVHGLIMRYNRPAAGFVDPDEFPQFQEKQE
jgi:hypothetical protein